MNELAYVLLVLFTVILAIIIATAWMKIHPVIVLLVASAILGLVMGIPFLMIIQTMTKGFGDLMASIGLIVVLGSILGSLLEKSGGVQRIGELILNYTPRRFVPVMMSVSGAIMGIPVFCDSGFLVLAGLAKECSKRIGIGFPVLSLSLATGLYTSHTLIPPTPGPVAAAGNLGVSDSLGIVILLGMILAIPVTLSGFWLTKWTTRHITLKIEEVQGSGFVTTNKIPVSFTLMLIMLPLVLIGGSSIAALIGGDSSWIQFVFACGQPIVALTMTVILGLILLPGKRFTKQEWVQSGVMQSGPILILTGCGGALGAVIKSSGLAIILEESVRNAGFNGYEIFGIGFILAMILKTAQGSTTAALVIASTILATVAPAAGLTTTLDLTLLVMAIGSGAMAVSHVNDSYFWVVSQYSGLTTAQALRTFSMITLGQAITGFVGVSVLYYVFRGA